MRTLIPSGLADQGVVLQRTCVGVELPAVRERHEVAAPLIDEEDAVAGAEGARHVDGFASSDTGTGTDPEGAVTPARSRNRQNAHTATSSGSSPRGGGVGAPHETHATRSARSASDVVAKSSCPRSTKPKKNAAFEPGDESSRSLSSDP